MHVLTSHFADASDAVGKSRSFVLCCASETVSPDLSSLASFVIRACFKLHFTSRDACVGRSVLISTLSYKPSVSTSLVSFIPNTSLFQHHQHDTLCPLRATTISNRKTATPSLLIGHSFHILGMLSGTCGNSDSSSSISRADNEAGKLLINNMEVVEEVAMEATMNSKEVTTLEGKTTARHLHLKNPSTRKNPMV